MFLITRPLRSKKMTEVASALSDALLSLSFSPNVLICDQGGEMVNSEMEKLCETFSMTACPLTIVNKNSVVAESSNSTLTNTLRKSLENASTSWVKNLQMATFAINNSIRNYAPEHDYTPSYIFNSRSVGAKIPIWNEDEEQLNVQEKIKQMNQERFKYDYDIVTAVKKRFKPLIGETYLVHEERVLSKKKLNIESTALKLESYWTPAIIRETPSHDIVVVETTNGVRKAHIRQLKPISPELMREIEQKGILNFLPTTPKATAENE